MLLFRRTIGTCEVLRTPRSASRAPRGRQADRTPTTMFIIAGPPARGDCGKMWRNRDERARSQTACARPGESLKCGLRCSVFGNARPVGKNCLRNFSERAARNAGSAQGKRNSATRLSGSRPALLPPLGNNGPEKPSPGCKVSLHSRATLSPPDARGSLLHNQFTGYLCVCPFCVSSPPPPRLAASVRYSRAACCR
jgi:hypothetical protein